MFKFNNYNSIAYLIKVIFMHLQTIFNKVKLKLFIVIVTIRNKLLIHKIREAYNIFIQAFISILSYLTDI